ncbi:MAG TPA: hypothetical protein VGB19_06210 [Actinomycetota bacterium]
MRGVCIHFREPVTGFTLPGWRSPNLTVTVADPEALVRVLQRLAPAETA